MSQGGSTIHFSKEDVDFFMDIQKIEAELGVSACAEIFHDLSKWSVHRISWQEDQARVQQSLAENQEMMDMMRLITRAPEVSNHCRHNFWQRRR